MKDLSKTILAVLATGLLSCGLLCQQTQAVPITGDIVIGGVVTYDTGSLATATTVTAWTGPNRVFSDSGSFAAFITPNVTPVTLTAPWKFAPVPGTPRPTLWTSGGFTFDLSMTTFLSQGTNFLNVLGVGTISGNGFTATPGTWSYSSSVSRAGAQGTFGFTSDTTATAVPDGGTTVALLGIAFVGLEGLRRKLKAG